MNYLLGFGPQPGQGGAAQAQGPMAPPSAPGTRQSPYGTPLTPNQGGGSYSGQPQGPWGPTYSADAVNRIMGPQAGPSMDPGRSVQPYGPTPQAQGPHAVPLGGGMMNAMGPAGAQAMGGMLGGTPPGQAMQGAAQGMLGIFGGGGSGPLSGLIHQMGMLNGGQQGGGGGGASQFPGGPNIGSGMMGPPGQGPAQQPVPFSPGNYGMQPGGGFSTQLPGTAPQNPMQQRMESVFGQLGTPTTALQQQSLGGISQFLNSNPYGQSNDALRQISGSGGQDFFGGAQNAYNDVKNANYFGGAKQGFNQVQNANYFGGAKQGFDELAKGNYYGGAEKSFQDLGNYNPFQPAQGMLEGMFQHNPGEGVMNAMHPMYERALAEANQTGGRFGSANAILRSRALDDYSLQMQQAMQRGVDQQLTGAGVYGQMGNSLIGAKGTAGQGLLGVGQGRMQQQTNAAQGQLGVGQGQLQQGLGAAQGLLGVGQGQMQQGLGAAQGLLGVGQGRSSYDLGNTQNRLAAAGQMANNQNSMFNNLNSAYYTGGQQASQEAQRQQQALQIMLGQLGVSQGAVFNQPTQVSPTGAQTGAQIGAGLGPLLASLIPGGGGGSPMPFQNPGAAAPSFGIPYGF